jgi:hypothetical protein
MRRFGWLTILFLGGLFPVLSAGAQSAVVFDAPYEYAPFGLKLFLPNGWQVAPAPPPLPLVHVAQNPDDLRALSDQDPQTRPNSFGLRLNALPLAELGLGTDAVLEEIEKALIPAFGLTVEERQDQPVEAFRARTLFGLSPEGPLILTFWRQGGHILLFSLHAPDPASVASWRKNWLAFLSGIQGADVLPLSEPITSQRLRMSLRYPADWILVDTLTDFAIYQSKNDFDLYQIGMSDPNLLEGVTIFAVYQGLQDLVTAGILPAEPTLDEFLALNVSQFGLQEVQAEEMVVLGQTAYLVRCVRNGFHVIGILGIADGDVYFILASAPRPALRDAFIPTFRAMLTSFKRP